MADLPVGLQLLPIERLIEAWNLGSRTIHLTDRRLISYAGGKELVVARLDHVSAVATVQVDNREQRFAGQLLCIGGVALIAVGYYPALQGYFVPPNDSVLMLVGLIAGVVGVLLFLTSKRTQLCALLASGDRAVLSAEELSHDQTLTNTMIARIGDALASRQRDNRIEE